MATHDDHVHLALASVQPIAGDDVAAAVSETALGEPTNSTAEFAGPEVFADPLARYFGNTLTETELLPGRAATGS